MDKPSKATKKPVTIEFIEWTGSNKGAVCKFTGERVFYHVVNDNTLVIPTLEGDHKAIVGDMIIKGVQGEFYPCKPDIFHATYDVELDDE